MSKEDFNKVFKDTTKEEVLNQFYYEHYDLINALERIDEATRVLNSAKNHYGNDGKNWALERAIRILGDKENE